MKAHIFAIVLSIALAATLVAQQQQRQDPAAPQPEYLGVSSAQMALREVSLSKFEDDAFWVGYIPRDDGFITLRRFEGSPLGKRPIENAPIPPIGGEATPQNPGFQESAVTINEPDIYVLGVKVTHLRRSVTYYSIKPIRPIPVPGIAKVLSLWVVGRNLRHRIFINVRDYFGNRARIYMGMLTHSGWEELKATIPPNIRQVNPRYNNRQGLQITEILIEPDPVETYGNYFVYFDDLRVITDLFPEANRDPDDMLDNW